MLILGLDCAGLASAAAIARSGQILAARSEPADQGKGDRFIPLIEKTFQDAGLSVAEMDLIAVNTGPGSFTGIRIALAAAEALSLALGKPVVGIDAFTLWQSQHPDPNPLLIVLESKRQELYVQAYDAKGNIILPAQSLLPEQIVEQANSLSLSFTLTGDARQKLPPHHHFMSLPQSDSLSLAEAASVFAAKIPNGEYQHYLPTPCYIRNADTSFPKTA